MIAALVLHDGEIAVIFFVLLAIILNVWGRYFHRPPGLNPSTGIHADAELKVWQTLHESIHSPSCPRAHSKLSEDEQRLYVTLTARMLSRSINTEGKK